MSVFTFAPFHNKTKRRPPTPTRAATLRRATRMAARVLPALVPPPPEAATRPRRPMRRLPTLPSLLLLRPASRRATAATTTRSGRCGRSFRRRMQRRRGWPLEGRKEHGTGLTGIVWSAYEANVCWEFEDKSNIALGFYTLSGARVCVCARGGVLGLALLPKTRTVITPLLTRSCSRSCHPTASAPNI